MRSVAEDLDRSRDAWPAGGSETVRVGATDEDGPGAQTQRLDDVAASSNPSVNQNVRAAVYCFRPLPVERAMWRIRRRAAVHRGSTR